MSIYFIYTAVNLLAYHSRYLLHHFCYSNFCALKSKVAFQQIHG